MFLCTFASNLLAFLGHAIADEATDTVEETAIPLALARGIISTLLLMHCLLDVFFVAIYQLRLHVGLIILIIGIIVEDHILHLVDNSSPLGIALASGGSLSPCLHALGHADLGQ